jgi:AAA family ATP:ADP antiporter
MKERLYQLLRLRSGELGVVVVLGLLLLCNSFALEVADVVAVSGFLSEVGLPQLLLVWIVDMTLIMLTTGLQSLVVDRFDRIGLIRSMIFAFIFVYTLLRILFAFGMPAWFNYSFLYLLSDQQWLFFPLVFWILANDIFDMAQAKRIFPLIASFGFVGQIIGLGMAAAAPRVLGSQGISSIELISVIVLIYLLALGVVSFGLRGVSIRETMHQSESVGEALAEGWRFINEVKSFRYLTLSMMVVGLALTIIEFHFLFVSDAIFTGTGNFQTFYSLYRLGFTVLAIIFQSLLTSRIINKFDLKNTFLILPSALLVSAVSILALPGIVLAAAGRGLSRLVYSTVDESARKAFQALVPEERRGRVSIFMESYLPAAGTILGSVILGIIVLIGLPRNTYYSELYLGLAAVAAIIAVWLVIQMRKHYDSSLWNWRLKRRQRRADVLNKLDF